LLVHNGLGGAATWRKVGELNVVPPPTWKTEVFTVAVQGDGAVVDAAIPDADQPGRDLSGQEGPGSDQ